MDQDIYKVVAEWKPNDSKYELDEEVSTNRTEHGAWIVLQSIAEDQGVDLRPEENSFEVAGDAHTEYYLWYITSGILGD